MLKGLISILILSYLAYWLLMRILQTYKGPDKHTDKIGVLKLRELTRERLKGLYRIETDKAIYTAYNTQTEPYDWVNIEIEEVRDGKRNLILKKEIFEDSYGAMAGESFNGLVIDSKNHLKDFIKENKEIIIEEKDI